VTDSNFDSRRVGISGLGGEGFEGVHALGPSIVAKQDVLHALEDEPVERFAWDAAD